MEFSGGGLHGVARWLTSEEAQAAGLFQSKIGSVLFGSGSKGYLQYAGDGHSMIVAPPGAGKGVGFVLPNLINYGGSMVVIDPKGENAALTAQHRDASGAAFVLDPSGVSGIQSDHYNPLSWLHHTSPENFLPELKVFAEAVIEGTNGTDSYWTNCARSVFVGLVCYLAAHETPENFNLNEVYNLSRLPFDKWLGLWDLMSKSTCAVPMLQALVRDFGAWYLAQEDDHQKYHLGTLQEAVGWMGNLSVARIMGKSSFDMRQLKNTNMTLYLCVHPTQVTAFRGWFRLIISQAVMSVFQSLDTPRDARGAVAAPVLFLLDEYARAVGRLSIIDNALPQIRGYGGRFAFVLQTIGQLKELYPQGWTTFEETSGLRVYLQSRGETAEFVSQRLGTKTIQRPGPGGIMQTGRPLLFPHEVSQLDKLDEVVFVEDLRPIKCRRLTSYSDKNLTARVQKMTGAPYLSPEQIAARVKNPVRLKRQKSEDAPARSASLFDQVQQSRKQAAPSAPTITPEQRDDLLRGGGWD